MIWICLYIGESEREPYMFGKHLQLWWLQPLLVGRGKVLDKCYTTTLFVLNTTELDVSFRLYADQHAITDVLSVHMSFFLLILD